SLHSFPTRRSSDLAPAILKNYCAPATPGASKRDNAHLAPYTFWIYIPVCKTNRIRARLSPQRRIPKCPHVSACACSQPFSRLVVSQKQRTARNLCSVRTPPTLASSQ